MRLRTEFWVKAYIRRCAVEGASAVVVRHGDDDAGSIFIKIDRLDGTCLLFGPAPAGLEGAESDRQWMPCLNPAGADCSAADAFLSREANFDSDLWIVEVEDRRGRHFLDDSLVTGVS
ncbi:DUF1491 family protein [Hyphomicrobium sp. 1Nfss2.1]|uniref:DUF1491 family protein n=1 Tax=Hyphomicrobium sp. 1Nfss2.1 TaxID=3413936 RepID=UPI003C7E2084